MGHIPYQVSKDEAGIKFYDRTPDADSPVAMFAGGFPEGKFLTDKASIERVFWDEEENFENQKHLVKYIDGSLTQHTIMVDYDVFQRIIYDIVKCEDPRHIIIDTRSNIKKL